MTISGQQIAEHTMTGKLDLPAVFNKRSRADKFAISMLSLKSVDIL